MGRWFYEKKVVVCAISGASLPCLPHHLSLHLTVGQGFLFFSFFRWSPSLPLLELSYKRFPGLCQWIACLKVNCRKPQPISPQKPDESQKWRIMDGPCTSRTSRAVSTRNMNARLGLTWVNITSNEGSEFYWKNHSEVRSR